MNKAKRVIKNTGILYAKMGITIFISLYTTRLVLDALGTEDFGIFNIVAGVVALLTFLNYAMTAATQRFMSHAEGAGEVSKKKQIFNISILIHFILAILLFFIIEIVGDILFEYVLKIPENRFDTAKIIFHFAVLSTIFTILTVPFDAVINAHENMLFFAIVSLIEVLLRFGAAIFITFTQLDKLIIFGVSFVIIKGLVLIIYFIYCRSKYDECVIAPKKYFDKTLFKKMTSFAGYSFLTSASSIITMQGTSVLLNSFFGVAVNAAQGVATQISGQLMSFSNTMLKALNPVIVKSEGEKDREGMLYASMIGNKYSNFLLSFFAIPILVEMPYIFSFWLKDVPEFAILFCKLHVIRLLLGQLTVTFPTAIGATGEVKQLKITESIIYLTLLPVSYMYFYFGSSPEVIYINLIFMVFALFIARVYLINKICKMPTHYFMKEIVFPCILIFTLSLSIAYIPTFFIDESFQRLLLVLCISSASYLAFIYIFGLQDNEKNLLNKAIAKVRNKFI